MKKLNFKQIGVRAAGVVGGGAAGSLINKVLPNMNPKVRSIIKIGAGIVLPELAPKSGVVNAAGVALAGVGAYELANEFLNPSAGTGVQGVGEDPDYTVINGDESVDGTEYVFGPNDAIEGANDAIEGNEEEF